jgi:MoaD family protein
VYLFSETCIRLTIKVNLGATLSGSAGKNIELELDSVNIDDVLKLVARLEEMFPNIRDRIFDEHDRTRPYVNIFVNEESIRYLGAEGTKLKDEDVIYILPSVAGG